MDIKRENQSLLSVSPQQTVSIGRRLASLLINGDVIVLTGPLGAGKTCLIKGIARGRGMSEDDVKSPSFTLVNEYQTEPPLFHFDLYRMQDISELYGIGWDDYLLRDGIVLVEWGEKAQSQLPPGRIHIVIEIISDSERHIDIRFL